MHQDWHELLFLHWEMRVEDLRPLIPEPLEIDTFDGKAWLTVTPLTITNLRPPYFPAIPYLSWLYELNVRTYVYLDGVPGVWFFSLDCNSSAAVMAARTFYHLPYYDALIDMEQTGQTIDYALKRTDDPPARFRGARPSLRW